MIIEIPIYSLHQRSDIYPEPEEFKPERFLGENLSTIPQCAFLPFGGGQRACIGMRFALSEMKITLAKLISHYKISQSEKHTKLNFLNGDVFLLSYGDVVITLEKRS